MMSLAQIVRERNLKALEHFCLTRTYREVREHAIAVGVDLDELEELLGML